MIITNIEIQKNNKEKVNIYVNNIYSFSLSLNGLTKFNLYNGKNIEENDIEYFKIEDEKNLAFMQLLDKLNYKMYTEKEIFDKLSSKKFSLESIEYAMNKAKELGYIDDSNYCKLFIEEKIRINKWGKNLIFSKLIQKGIDKDILNECLKDFFEDDFSEENCYNLALKKMELLKMNDFSDKKNNDKLYRFLLSKGYSYEEINNSIEKLKGEVFND